MLSIQYLEELFYDVLREFKVREVGLIPEVVEMG